MMNEDMITLEISPESAEFIAQLIDAIDAQDNRATAAPYFYVIQERYGRPVPDGLGDEVRYWDHLEGDEYTPESLVERYNEEQDDGGEYVPREYLEHNTLEDWGELGVVRKADEIAVAHEDALRRYEVKPEWECRESHNAFLTEAAAKRHLEVNGHNFHNPTRIYLMHAFRNEEMQNLFASLREIADSLKDRP